MYASVRSYVCVCVWMFEQCNSCSISYIPISRHQFAQLHSIFSISNDNISVINFLLSRFSLHCFWFSFELIFHTQHLYNMRTRTHSQSEISAFHTTESPIFLLLKPEFLITHGIICHNNYLCKLYDFCFFFWKMIAFVNYNEVWW